MSDTHIEYNIVYPETDLTIGGEALIDEAVSVEMREHSDRIANIIIRLRTPYEVCDDSREGQIIRTHVMEYDTHDEMLEAMRDLEDWVDDIIGDIELPNEYITAYKEQINDYIMPNDLTFDNGLVLNKYDKPVDCVPISYPGQTVYIDALCYRAAKLFRDLDGDDTLEAVDDGTFIQQNELYLNGGDGYDDDTGDFFAKTLAIDKYGVVFVQCWDHETGNHSYWYTVA